MVALPRQKPKDDFATPIGRPLSFNNSAPCAANAACPRSWVGGEISRFASIPGVEWGDGGGERRKASKNEPNICRARRIATAILLVAGAAAARPGVLSSLKHRKIRGFPGLRGRPKR
jgi:hypothetical protein